MFVVTATIDPLLGPLSITISDTDPCRSISTRSRNYRGVDIGCPLLLRLIVVVRVVNDDYLAITRRPRMSRLRSPKSFLVNSSREVSTTSEEGLLTRVALEAPPYSNTKE
jgi:hypothetical protein